MMEAGFFPEASDIVFYAHAGLGRSNQARTHRHRATVGGDASRQEAAFCRGEWSTVPAGKRTRLNNWFSSAHDLIAFATSRGSAIPPAAGRSTASANGLGYDVPVWTRQHTTSWTH